MTTATREKRLCYTGVCQGSCNFAVVLWISENRPGTWNTKLSGIGNSGLTVESPKPPDDIMACIFAGWRFVRVVNVGIPGFANRPAVRLLDCFSWKLLTAIEVITSSLAMLQRS